MSPERQPGADVLVRTDALLREMHAVFGDWQEVRRVLLLLIGCLAVKSGEVETKDLSGWDGPGPYREPELDSMQEAFWADWRDEGADHA